MKNIAITGISGYIGTSLFRHLDGIDGVQRIIGIDIKPPGFESAKLRFYAHDILTPFGDLFVDNEVDTAIHLAFVLKPTRNRTLARQIDHEGTINFLQACQQASVRQIVYLSSHTVYGAHSDNPVSLTEDSPSRPLPDFQYSWDKAQAEKILHEFSESVRNTTLSILRSCPVIGPEAAGSVPTLMFELPFMIGVAGYDPLMQFVHEDDLARLIGFMLTWEKGGVFNVAGDGNIMYSEAAKLAKKRMLKLPGRLLDIFLSISWAMHLQSSSPASGLKFIKYPPVVNTEKLKKETGFRFQYSTKEALSSFLSAGR